MATSIQLRVNVLILVFFSCFIIAQLQNDDEYEGSRTLVLEHLFQTGTAQEFSKRGTIVIQSRKENRAQFTAASSLSEDDIFQLKSSAGKDGLYKVRIPVKVNSETGSQSYVSSATKACGIVESGLKDEITINFDQSGKVLGVSIKADVSSCAGFDIPDSNLSQWRTAIEVTTTVAGPVPDTQTYIEKMKRDEHEKLKNQDGDNRSFLGKYWMYIVPVVIMMVIMSSADQQNQGGGGGR